MEKQKGLYNRRKWQHVVLLLLLMLVILAIRAWGFKDRVLGLEEAERYLALYAQADAEKSLWLYRLRELGWIAGGMLLGATAGWWLLGFGGSALLICALGICPSRWWVLVLTIALILAGAGIRKLPAWKRLPAMVMPIVRACACVTFGALTLVNSLKEGKANQNAWAKVNETLALIESVDESLLLYNQPKYEEFFAFYLPDKQLSWHEEVDLSKLENEYAYMIYEEGLWFVDREVKEYGITYTDLGTLWFPGVENSVHLLQVQWGKYSARVRSEKAVQEIQKNSMDGVLVSMFPMHNFEEEYFELFLNSKIVNLDTVMTTGRQLVGALEYILPNTNTLQTVYMGLAQEDMGEEQNWTELLTVVQKYPEIHFQVLLESPCVEDLLEESQAKAWEKALTTAVEKFEEVQNVELAYVGSEDWLFLNKGNITEDGGYTDELAKNVAANALMSKIYPINSDNVEAHVKQQLALIDTYKSGRYDFENGQGKKILFLGDSIFGYSTGSASIPGVVESLFGAKTYNLGYGGLSATTDAEKGVGAWQLLQGALTGDVKNNHLEGNTWLCQQIDILHEDEIIENAGQGEELVFVLNFGLNDYFSEKPLGTIGDQDTTSYLGAMRKVLTTLQKNYPKATILVLTQSLVVEFEYGTEKRGPEEKTLSDFRQGLVELVEELGIPYLNINDRLGLEKENLDHYLADGTHPNFYGNFCYGYEIARKLEEVLQ